jgi:exopolyphosphatase/guanosine-5'-triphosphate,3'-diphosphate pyrophosphatase
MRIAAIDIGTNSIHMVIARATGGPSFEVVDREREVVQTGRGSFEGGWLRADAIRRTVAALARFADLARRQQADRILCTATAAVREARNGGSLVRAARAACGVAPRVIPAEEEGRLIYLAVKSALQLDEAPALIVDIGGGSVQLVVADRDRLIETHTAPLGALRLYEALLGSDPPGRRDLQRLRRRIRRLAAPAIAAVAASGPTRVYGSSGSIHALAQMVHREESGEPLEQLNGHVLAREPLERLTRELQRMELAEREELIGLDPHRAEIILPAAMVLEHLLRELEREAITISDFGVREGLVVDYLLSHATEVRAIGDIEDLRLRSVLRLLQKCQPEERELRHARHVAALALALFDGLRRSHRLGADAREILHYAALLHDVGVTIAYDGHAQHSYYIIRNGSLRGLSADEVERIAAVARHHGKARPRKRDPLVRGLDKGRRRELRWLSALLRIAEALDRSHYQLVRTLQVGRSGRDVVLRLTTRPGARLEVWAAHHRIDLLQKLLGRAVRIAARVVRREPRRTAGRAADRGVLSRRPAARRAPIGRAVALPLKPRPAAGS